MNAVHQSKKIFSVKRELKESLRFRTHSTMSKGGTSFHERRTFQKVEFCRHCVDSSNCF